MEIIKVGGKPAESGTRFVIRIISSENERSWAAEMIGAVMSAIYTEHHHSREGMIFLTEHGWHPISECAILSELLS